MSLDVRPSGDPQPGVPRQRRPLDLTDPATTRLDHTTSHLTRSPAMSGTHPMTLHDAHLLHEQLARSHHLSRRAAEADRRLRMVRALKAARKAERATLRARQLMVLAVTR